MSVEEVIEVETDMEEEGIDMEVVINTAAVVEDMTEKMTVAFEAEVEVAEAEVVVEEVGVEAEAHLEVVVEDHLEKITKGSNQTKAKRWRDCTNSFRTKYR